MLQVLEAAIAIMLLLSTLVFFNFNVQAQYNLTEIRYYVYNDPDKLKEKFEYVHVEYFCSKFRNVTYGSGTPKYIYLFVGNESIFCPALILIG